jgi:hypothetical protein
MATDPRAEYDRIVVELAAEADTVSSKMFGVPVLKKHGKAFAGYFTKHEAMTFKLRGEAHAGALALPGAHLFDPSGEGRPMREWVEVPATGADSWPELAREALEYLEDTLGRPS